MRLLLGADGWHLGILPSPPSTICNLNVYTAEIRTTVNDSYPAHVNKESN